MNLTDVVRVESRSSEMNLDYGDQIIVNDLSSGTVNQRIRREHRSIVVYVANSHFYNRVPWICSIKQLYTVLQHLHWESYRI